MVGVSSCVSAFGLAAEGWVGDWAAVCVCVCVCLCVCGYVWYE